jgi:siroheme synthase
VTIGPPAALPAALDPARTLVTATDDTSWAVDRLARHGEATMPAAVVTTARGGLVGVVRGALGELPSDPRLGPGVVVVGAVAAARVAAPVAGAGAAEDEGEVVGG